jgi:hypothetical protein
VPCISGRSIDIEDPQVDHGGSLGILGFSVIDKNGIPFIGLRGIARDERSVELLVLRK